MKITVTRTDRSTDDLIALAVDARYLIIADNHHIHQCHHIFSEFEVCAAPEGTLQSKLDGYGERAEPIYMGDAITIQTGLER